MHRSLLMLLLIAAGSLHAEVLDNASITRMVQAGLSADIIVIKIDRSEARFDVTADALIALKAANVPDGVIKAMLLKQPASATPAPPAPPPTPQPPATSLCIKASYYTLGANGWAWAPASVCVTPTEISVEDQNIKLDRVAAHCAVKSSFLGDAEWWFTDHHETFKFRGKESDLHDVAAMLERVAPAARHGACSDRGISALFPK